MFPYCPLPKHITVLYVLTVVNCVTLCHMTFVGADVIVVSQKTNVSVQVYPDRPAQFGPELTAKGLNGLVVYANPSDACTAVEPPPSNFTNPTGNWILLIRRSECNFDEKVRNAQAANYNAAIVHNVNSNRLEPMGSDDPYDIYIPSVFIGEDDGRAIYRNYLYNKGYAVILTDDPQINLNNYLLPFAVVVGICFVVMLIFMIVKCVKDRRRMRRHRLPSSSLKKIPTSKYSKGDPYETCAICLEDYVEGEKLRVLPCAHAYHCKCIDPWLTKNKRVCPVCKRKVFAQDEHFTDSESDSDDETAPLLSPSSYGTQGGTFNTQRTNPLARANASDRPRIERERVYDSTSSDEDEDGDAGYSNEGFANDDESANAKNSQLASVSIENPSNVCVTSDHSINGCQEELESCSVVVPNVPVEIALDVANSDDSPRPSTSGTGRQRRSDLVV